MVKIVISVEYKESSGIGNFRLSDDAVEYLIVEKGWKCYDNIDDVVEGTPYIFQWENSYIPTKIEYVVPHTLELRTHPDLIDCIEILGDGASGYFSHLKIVEIPDSIDWELCQCNGVEWVAEKHRRWR